MFNGEVGDRNVAAEAVHRNRKEHGHRQARAEELLSPGQSDRLQKAVEVGG